MPPPLHAQPDPYAIFARARSYFERQQYPPYLKYDVAVNVVEGGKTRTERYASAYNATTNEIVVDPVSDFERANPPSGRGVNIAILFVPLGKPQPPVDFLGVPMLSPTYSFGIAKFAAMQSPHKLTDAELVAAIRKEFHDPNPRATPRPTATPAGLPEIADVTVYKRDYVITLAGEEEVNGHTCFHLAMQPVRANDHRYRLRDVWIDETTYATERVNESINFVNGPGTAVPWSIDYTDNNGMHYIRTERASAPMSYRGMVYTQASVDFENVTAAQAMPHRLDTPLTNDLVMEEPVY